MGSKFDELNIDLACWDEHMQTYLLTVAHRLANRPGDLPQAKNDASNSRATTPVMQRDSFPPIEDVLTALDHPALRRRLAYSKRLHMQTRHRGKPRNLLFQLWDRFWAGPLGRQGTERKRTIFAD